MEKRELASVQIKLLHERKRKQQTARTASTSLQRDIAMFLLRVGQLLGLEKIQVQTNAPASGMWLDDIVNKTCKLCCDRASKSANITQGRLDSSHL